MTAARRESESLFMGRNMLERSSIVKWGLETQKAAPSQSGLTWEWRSYSGFDFQRAAAAFFAMADRLAGLSAAARAFPPFRPPRRPRATAAGFFRWGRGTPPVAACTMEAASWFWSSLFLLERLGMDVI